MPEDKQDAVTPTTIVHSLHLVDLRNVTPTPCLSLFMSDIDVAKQRLNNGGVDIYKWDLGQVIITCQVSLTVLFGT